MVTRIHQREDLELNGEGVELVCVGGWGTRWKESLFYLWPFPWLSTREVTAQNWCSWWLSTPWSLRGQRPFPAVAPTSCRLLSVSEVRQKEKDVNQRITHSSESRNTGVTQPHLVLRPRNLCSHPPSRDRNSRAHVWAEATGCWGSRVSAWGSLFISI